MFVNDSASFPHDLADFDLHAKASIPTFYRPLRTNFEGIIMANNNEYKVPHSQLQQQQQQQQHHQSQQHHQQHHHHQHQHSGGLLNGYDHDPMQHQVNGFPAQHSYAGEPLHQHQQQQQQQQQHQQQHHHRLTPPISNEPLQIIDGNGTGDGQKGNRLRKACDSCSIRKVKCDESGPPCRACASLDIPCTFERPSRRRGPPNRHAEAIKRRRLEQESGFSSTPSSPSNVAATLASFSSHAVLSAESICPFSTLELLVDDFFTYIHPLVPFPHEPSFRAAFKHREDLTNPQFLALLASMISALVASFPRKPRLHLKAQNREKLFPNSISLVERCHKVAVEARGAGYLDKDLTVYDAATSYFLGLGGAYTFNWKQCRLYFAETLTIARSLGVHKNKDASYYSVGDHPTGSDENGFGGKSSEAPDYIKQEIGRRVFWVVYVGIRSMQQMGASFPELTIPPPTRTEPYPPLPLEVDDDYIFVSHVDLQPAGIVSRLTGFNLNVQIYTTCTPLNTMELAYGNDELFDWSRQKRVLEECLGNVKHVLDLAPPELMLAPDPASLDFETDRRQQYYPPTSEFPTARSVQNGGSAETREDQDRRALRFEIQKANIFASQLATRSFIVEKYWNLYEAYQRLKSSGASSEQSSPNLISSGLVGIMDAMANGNNMLNNATSKLQSSTSGHLDLIESQMSSERESIVKDLLRVLGSISQVNMEPNGGSFINKIRQIASTLLDTPRNRKSPLALRAEEYLGRFLDVLMKLERISPGRSSGEEWEDEEEELRNWADLREFQTKFLTAGGFDG